MERVSRAQVFSADRLLWSCFHHSLAYGNVLFTANSFIHSVSFDNIIIRQFVTCWKLLCSAVTKKFGSFSWTSFFGQQKSTKYKSTFFEKCGVLYSGLSI